MEIINYDRSPNMGEMDKGTDLYDQSLIVSCVERHCIRDIFKIFVSTFYNTFMK